MNLSALVFFFLTFSMFKAMVIADANPGALSFPTLSFPTFELRDVPGCSDVGSCLGSIVVGFINVGAFLFWIAKSVINVIIFLGAIVVAIARIQITGVQGAPSWVNALIVSVFAVNLSLILYKLLRKGDVDTS